jgi:hypothetical protein
MQELTLSRTGSGNGTVTSSPSGIDCGSACRTYFDADSVVMLTATPTSFSTFDGWSGNSDCSDGVVTLSAAASCTATFTGTCGAANEDCDDGNPCTVDSCPADDHCENATIPRAASACFAAGKSRVKLINSPDARADKLSWQWGAGAAMTQADFGDPSEGTDFTLCIYDASAASANLAATLSLPAGGLGWRSHAPKGWNWSDRHATLDGIKKLTLKPGTVGKSKVKLAASGDSLPLPAPFSVAKFFDLDPVLVLQLVSSDDKCWSSTFTSIGTTTNTPELFKAAAN